MLYSHFSRSHYWLTRSCKANQLPVWVTSHRFQISKRWFQKCHVALPELHPWLGFSFTQQDHLQQNLTDAIWSGAMHDLRISIHHAFTYTRKKLKSTLCARTIDRHCWLYHEQQKDSAHSYRLPSHCIDLQYWSVQSISRRI